MSEDAHHITSSLDRDLDSLFSQVLQLGEAVERALVNVANQKAIGGSLADAERQKEKKTVTEAVALIKQECVKITSIRQPLSKDLHRVFSATKLSTLLKQCWDQAEAIAMLYDSIAHDDSQVSLIGRFHQELVQMLRKSINAALKKDVGLGSEVEDSNKELKQACKSVFRESLTYIFEDSRNISSKTQLTAMAANWERMGDILCSIANEASVESAKSEALSFPLIRPDGSSTIRRDQFDLLRDLDILLGELIVYFRQINDPDRISRDFLYIKAAAQSLQSFIETYENEPSVEIPSQLPQTLKKRIQSVELKKIDGIATITQRIVDIITKLFG